MKAFKIAINLLLIVLVWYLGFTILSGGDFNPVNWPKTNKLYFVWITFGCILTYGILSAEPPNSD